MSTDYKPVDYDIYNIVPRTWGRDWCPRPEARRSRHATLRAATRAPRRRARASDARATSPPPEPPVPPRAPEGDASLAAGGVS